MAKKKRLLIAEDDRAIRELYALKFANEGFDVQTAVDGGAAWEITKKELPDLVLLDIMMPVMNGFEYLEKLKKNKETAKIPVLIISNYGGADRIKKGLQIGAKEYLIKADHTLGEIVNVVNKTLDSND